eukprot:156088_1
MTAGDKQSKYASSLNVIDDGKDSNLDDSKREETKFDEDDLKGSNEDVEEEEIPIQDLLLKLDFKSSELSNKLTELGSGVGLLSTRTHEKRCYDALKGLLEAAEHTDATIQLQNSLNSILQQETQKHLKYSLQFITLLGYEIRYLPNEGGL